MRRKISAFVTLTIMSLFFYFLTAATATAGTQEANCKWAGPNAKADGNLDEWKGMPTTFFEDERLILGVSNDSNFLYLYFRTDNSDLVRAVRMTGLKLWLDPKGKKKKNLEFDFRGGPSMEELARAGMIDSSRIAERPGAGMPPKFQQQEKGDRITLTDKKLDLNLDIPADGSRGPIVRHAVSQGYCIYEFAIPLQDHLVDYYGFNANPGQKVGIGVQWGGEPERGMRGDGPPGGMGGGPPGGGGGGMPPGGMGGDRGGMGGPPGGMGNRGQMPEKTEVWVKTILAVPQTDQNEGK